MALSKLSLLWKTHRRPDSFPQQRRKCLQNFYLFVATKLDLAMAGESSIPPIFTKTAAI
jgi:hypothetical protein